MPHATPPHPIDRAVSWLGHRAREARLHAQRRLAPEGTPSLLVFPGGPRDGNAAGLRAWNIADRLRHQGFRTVVVPKQLELVQRQRVFRAEHPDIVLFQKCRDPLHHPDHFPGAIHVLDLDDADFVDPKLTGRMTEVASKCHGAIAGSRHVAAWLESHCPRVRLIWTGSPMADHTPSTTPGARPDTVGFAVSDVLRYRREAEFVREVAVRVARRRPFTLRVQGAGDPDEIRRLFAPVEEAGATLQLVPHLPYDAFVRSLEQLAVGLAPLFSEPDSFGAGKSFGKILAYLAADVPVVTSDAADHAVFFRHGVSGYIARDPDDWADAVLRYLQDPTLRDRTAAEARRDFVDRLSLDAAANQTADFLRSLTLQPEAGDRTP